MPQSRHRKKKRSTRHSTGDERVGVMRQTTRLPFLECLINEDWQESRLASITFARSRPGGHVAVASLLIDVGCLGVKSAFANPDITAAQYEHMFIRMQPSKPLSVDPAYAVKLVLGALEYAKELGFKPDPDYFWAREIFGDIDWRNCEETFEYGLDGKPFFVAGPDDDAKRIMKHLIRKVGLDGFRFTLAVSDEDPDADNIFELVPED